MAGGRARAARLAVIGKHRPTLFLDGARVVRGSGRLCVFDVTIEPKRAPIFFGRKFAQHCLTPRDAAGPIASTQPAPATRPETRAARRRSGMTFSTVIPLRLSAA